jgi:hypothetical protein
MSASMHTSKWCRLAKGIVAAAWVAISALPVFATSTTAGSWVVVEQTGLVVASQVAPGATKVDFAASDMPVKTLIELAPENDGVRLSGNFKAAGMRFLAYQVESNGLKPQSSASGSQVKLVSVGTGRAWKNSNLIWPTEAGQTVVNTIGMARSDGWELTDGSGANLDDMWAEDMRSVSSVSMVIMKASTAFKTYTISNFKLEGDRSMNDASVDSDGDGMTDMAEMSAENDANDPNGYFAKSLFRVRIVGVGDEGTTLEWACVAGNRYTLLKSATVGGEPVVVTTLPSPKTGTGYMGYVDLSPETSASFYWVRQEP